MDDLIAELVSTGGAPAAKWHSVGDIVKITVTSIERRRETDFATGQPVIWPDGNPKFQWVFAGVTADGDEQRIFARGRMLAAIKEALREANVTAGQRIEGGTLTVKWVGEQPSQTKGFAPAKLWKAKFEVASAVVDDDLI